MRILKAVAVVVILLGGLLRAGEPPTFWIKVAVSATAQEKSSQGTGAFAVPENEYGRISLVFYDGVGDFSIRVAGAKQIPMAHLVGNGGRQVRLSEPSFVADLYLRPSVVMSGNIRLSGIMTRMTRVSDPDEILFAYSEEKLDFVLPDGGSQAVILDTGDSGKEVHLDISVNSSADLVYEPTTMRHVTFKTHYNLYNENAGQYELQGEGCTLGMVADGQEGVGTCSHSKKFPLADGDTLLYMTAYNIEKVTWNDDNSLTFDFAVTHVYALNPEDGCGMFEELRSEHTTVEFLNKEIVARPGERTEIEIPSDGDSPLPFTATETIVLINSVTLKGH